MFGLDAAYLVSTMENDQYSAEPKASGGKPVFWFAGVAGVVVLALAFALGHALAPSASEATVAKQAAFQTSKKSSYDEAFAASKKRGTVKGLKRGAADGDTAGASSARKEIAARGASGN
jgi:hypothetical protein